jgi:UDP-N-acetylglucosamine 1-carboxyvinyltransferase
MHSAVISGPTKLHSAELEIPDLRAGFSYLIAALAASGTSTVHGISLINRGYEDFADKLNALGARFEFGELPVP